MNAAKNTERIISGGNIMTTRATAFPQFSAIIVFFLLILSSIILVYTTLSYSAEVVLAWDPNTEEDLAGYKVYYGFESGNYAYSVDVGNQVRATISDVEPNKVYYFTATAYDMDGNESDFSDEIFYHGARRGYAAGGRCGPRSKRR